MSHTKARKRAGVVVAVAVAALLATACESKDDKSADKGPAAATSDAAGTGGAVGNADGSKDDAAKGEGGSSDKPADKPSDKPAAGDKGKYTADLKAYLSTTKLGSHVVEVRADKQTGSDYTITVNTDLPPTAGATDDGALKAMAMGEKLTNETHQWVQAHGDLKVGYIEVLDKEKGTAGNENLDNKSKDKAANDAYAQKIAAGIKGSTYGSAVTEVFVYAGPYGSAGKVVVNTTLPARADDIDADLEQMDKASKLAEETKQWIQDNAGVKVDYIEILDAEKGLAGNEMV
ncbi:hypothetical protein [Yinghuangia sp. YIM S09857]|uniref:hypothetical protein n=1 Tax=Yinghuangia sp. YIM S09857 TaxID=3436929 RepID=UPI003F53AD29